MTRIALGTNGAADVHADLASLLETRFLVQANSGGGKSWLLRRLVEQAAPHTQIVIIDPEGEFATLRERFDFVICAPKDADAVAHPRTAALLARKLLETGVSAVVDIYELKAHERPAFVRAFFDAFVNAPRALWRPVLIVLDEAHMFAPEKGKAESTGAVIDLATRGRKRGFALCCATQRLSKLHKDVAAEMLNKLIGRTGLDLDVERAADELGLGRKVAFEKLRSLPAGDFYAFGPAIATIPTQIRVGNVQTSHPKACAATSCTSRRDATRPVTCAGWCCSSTRTTRCALPSPSDSPSRASAPGPRPGAPCSAGAWSRCGAR